MDRILYFHSSATAYEAQAAILACPDARFDPALRKLTERLGLRVVDMFRIVGGPKALSSGTSAERQFVLDQLRASARLHNTTRVLLVAHSDCGAYGGLKGCFGGDPQRERHFHHRELLSAAAVISEALGAWRVDRCFIEFERLLYESGQDKPKPPLETLSVVYPLLETGGLLDLAPANDNAIARPQWEGGLFPGLARSDEWHP